MAAPTARQSRTPAQGGKAPVADGQRHDDPGKGGNRPDGEVDVSGDDHQHHADRQDEDVGVAVEKVHHVGRGQHVAAGPHVEERDEGDQGEQHAEPAEITHEDVLQLLHRTLPLCCPGLSAGRPPAPVRVMSFISFSWLASARSSAPVIAPSQMA